MTTQVETHATIARRPSTGAGRAWLVCRKAGLLLLLAASFLAAPAAAQQNELISINVAGTAAGNGNSGMVLGTMGPRASADGRFVVFESNANDLVPGGTTTGRVNVYLRDRLNGVTTLISGNVGGTLDGNGNSFSPTITPNGRFIVFLSNATSLVMLPDPNGSLLDVFRHDTCFGAAAGCTPAMELVSVNSAGTASGNNRVSIGNLEVAPHPLRAFVASDDGNRILFASRATDLVPGFVDGNGSSGADLYVRDMSAGQTFLITPNAAGTASSNSRHGSFDMDPTGTAIAFHSSSTDLTGQADTTVIDIFFRELSGTTLGPVRNLTAGLNDTTTVVGLGEGPAGASFVIGHTFATNHSLPEGNGNNPDLILLNPQTLQRTLITTKFDGSATANAGTTGIEKLVPAGGTSYLLGFTTNATDLLDPPVLGNIAQGYLGLLQNGVPAPVQLSSVASGGGPANADIVELLPFVVPSNVEVAVIGTRATNLTADIVNGTKVQLFVVDVAGNGVLLTKGQGGQSGDGDASLPFVSFNPATSTTLVTHVNNSTNLASVPNPAGNLNVFTSAILSSAPDLVIAKSDSTPFVDFMVGAQAFYEIVVTNIATNFSPPFSTTDVITVTDNLPAGLTFASHSGSGWMCTANGQMVTCTHPGPVFQGTDLPLLTLTVNVGAAALPSVTNFASVFTAGDSNPRNDFSNVAVTPVQPAASPTVFVDANGDVQYNAPAGQVNDVTVTLAPTGQLVISDANNPVIPGNGFVPGATPNEVVSVGPAPNTGGSFNLGDADDRFRNLTSSFSALTVDTGPGDDFVEFAPTTAATISLTDPAGSNQATFNGPANATTFDISDLRLTYGPLTANYSGFQRAIVLGNGAADIFNVRLDGAAAVPFTLNLDGKGSDDAYNIQLGGFGNVVNISDSGSTTGDTLTVSQNEGGTMELNSNSLIFSNDMASYTGIERVNAAGSPFDDNFFYRVPLLPGALDGGGGTNKARFEGDSRNNTVTIVVTAVDVDGNQISFVNIIEIEAQMGDGDDILNLTPSPTTAFNLNGGPGGNTLNVFGTPGNDTRTLSDTLIQTNNKADVRILNWTQIFDLLGDGDDTATVTPSPTTRFELRGGTGSNVLTVNGTAGNDVLTLRDTLVQANSNADVNFGNWTLVIADLGDGDDTGNVTPSPTTAFDLRGGPGNNTLGVVDTQGGNDTVNVTPTLILWNGVRINFASFGNLVINSGAGNDTVNVMPSPTTLIELDGGPDTDILNFDAGGLQTAQMGNIITAIGQQPATHFNFESVILLNAQPPQVDLGVTVSESLDPITFGDTVTYVWTVNNFSAFAGTNVVLKLTFPIGTTAMTSTNDGTCGPPVPATSFFDVFCDLNVGANGMAAVTTVATPAAAGLHTVTGTVTADETDPVGGNNMVTENTLVTTLSADLSVTVTDMPDPVAVGGNATYSILVSNAGPSIATGVSLDITLPASTTFFSGMTTQGTCGAPMGLPLNCAIGTLAPGASATVTVVVNPTATGMFTLDADVTSGVPDPNRPNNNDSETTTANPSADVSVTKTNSPDPVNPGANLISTIIVRNNGPSPATGVTVVDTLPFGALFSSAMATQGVCSGPVPAGFDLTCDIAAIPSGGMVTITVVTNIQGAVTGTLTNNVTVTAAEPDPNPANNMASATTNIAAIADLSITKTDSPDPVNFGANITYTITVTNNGPSIATNVSISDALPMGLTFVSAMLSPSGPCQFGSGVVTCNVGVMNSGTSATATVVVTASVTGSVSNTATVTSNVPDQNPGNNSATAVTMVNPPTAPTGINVSASPSSRTVARGQAATFNITIGATPAGALFNAPVRFSGMSNPPGAIIAFSPNPAPPGSTVANTTMTVFVPRNTAMLPGFTLPPWPGLVLAWLALALVATGAIAGKARQRRLAYCLPVGLLFLLLALGGCAQSSSMATTGPVTVNVTATSGTISQSTTVTVNVVP